MRLGREGRTRSWRASICQYRNLRFYSKQSENSLELNLIYSFKYYQVCVLQPKWKQEDQLKCWVFQVRENGDSEQDSGSGDTKNDLEGDLQDLLMG